MAKSSSVAEVVAPAAEAAEMRGTMALLRTALTSPDALTRATQFATIGLFIIALLWCAYVAKPVIVPVLLAWVIATIVLPIVNALEKRGSPRVVASAVVTLLLLTLIMGLLLLLSTPVTYWVGRASEVGSLIRAKLQTFNQPLELLQDLQKSLNTIASGGGGAAAPTIKVDTSSAGSVVETIFSALTPAVSQSLLFIGALMFYLVYQKRIRSLFVKLVKERDARLAVLKRLSDIDSSMSVYFGTFTLVNLCLGFVTTLLTWAVGLPNPLLWGVLTAVLNYVPYIGPGIVTGTLAVVGLLTFPTTTAALIAPVAFLVIVTIEGQIITPTVVGRRLELNPFAVFLAIAFCTWLWGPIGAFLATPILMSGTLLLSHIFVAEKPALPD
jgi:predicted PurR-regulated permease PerM